MEMVGKFWIETDDNRWIRVSEIAALEIRLDKEEKEFPCALHAILDHGLPITDENGKQTLETECVLEYYESLEEARNGARALMSR